ncbi:hypothetical protein ISS03_04365 [Patescibacteria group bacterium]|nr:hypothetical protein [Patescibacteria group bacterium]
MVASGIWKEELRIWSQGQISMESVCRWSRFERTGIRRQTNLAHTHGLTTLGIILLEKLKPHIQIDDLLVIEALHIHDISEGILQRDISALAKVSQHDLEEYEAFEREFSILEEAVYNRLRKAFLLQFVLKDYSWLPPNIQSLVCVLKESYYMEAKVLRSLELWDYFMFGLEQYSLRKNPDILVSVVKTNIVELSNIANQIPGFCEEVWTKEVVVFLEQFSSEHTCSY